VLVKRNSTVGDVFRKVMGDVPLAFVETVGGVRVSEDDAVAVGKNDVSAGSSLDESVLICAVDFVFQGRKSMIPFELVS
jgi:hypothetical protein